MKKLLLFIISFSLIFVSFIYISQVKVHASYGLDEIELYEIVVDPDISNGSLNIHITLDWKVLDDTSEGPLTWIKVGCVNYHINNLQAISKNISKIKYYSDEGSFVRIDLDRKYYAGEKLRIEYSYNQEYVYRLKDGLCYYDYNPGYFPEIIVDKCILKWSTRQSPMLQDGSTTPTRDEFKYQVFERNLSYGGYIKVKYVYKQTDFENLDLDKQYTSDYITPKQKGIIICFILVIVSVIVIIIIASYQSRDPYEKGRGFYGPHFYYHHYYYPLYRKGVNSSGKKIEPTVVGPVTTGGHSGGGFSCACACACAGGGRAGCSKKDFYNTNLDSKRIIKVLEEEK